MYFHEHLLRGNRSKKISSVSYRAFNSPNFPPLGTVEAKVELNQQLLLEAPLGTFTIRQLKNTNIANIKLFPGMSVKFIEDLLELPLHALVLGTYGSGNAPQLNTGYSDAFKKADEQGGNFS